MKEYVKITCCGDCIYYDWKKHKCKRGAVQEGKPQDHFFRDCPAGICTEGWISVDEKKPGPFETVLISILSKNGYGEPATVETIGCFQNGTWKSYTGPILPEERVTHWMPMPAP